MSSAVVIDPDELGAADRAFLEKLHVAHCRVCSATEGTSLADLPNVPVGSPENYVAELAGRFAPDASPVSPEPLPRLLRAVRGPDRPRRQARKEGR